MLLTQLIPGQGLGRVEVAHCVEQTWPNLLSRTGDSATRLRAMATAFIQVGLMETTGVIKDYTYKDIIDHHLQQIKDFPYTHY